MTQAAMQTPKSLACRPQLDDYQSRFVANVRECIGGNWLSRRPNIRILDNGCDTSGRQLWHLKQLTRGEVVGVNISDDFPSPEASFVAGPGANLLRMDGMDLRFPSESFDMVVSANVMEHVGDVNAYLGECARVLKPNGVAYIETAPVWTSARGHHIMEMMVQKDCPEEQNFRDDGSVIPEWSHLMLSEAEMAGTLESLLLPETCRYILSVVYHSDVLNRISWSSMRSALEQTFTHSKITTWALPNIRQEAKPRDSTEDYDVYGFAMVGRKRRQGGLERRLYWRLRRVGL